jgi:HAE1 family hydrophobic/amphiphilic exporter-1/multidrug efflux pump
VLPLAISSGAGAAARHAVGTGVMGGMLAATFLAIFFVPFFYKLIMERKVGEKRTSEELKREASHHREMMLHKTSHSDVPTRRRPGMEGSDD